MDKNRMIPSESAKQSGASDASQQEMEYYDLLANRVRRCTSGDSSSVPVDMARELAESVAYTLACAKREAEKRGIRLHSVSEAFSLGQNAIQQKCKLGSRLYRKAIETKLTLNHVCYHESLKEIGAFFGRYDAEFFSHEIPCSIDYPLAHPLIEARGVDYICGWLSRIIAENEFCLRFDPHAMHALHSFLYPGYEEVPLNLYEPVAFAALGLTLCGKEPYGLSMHREDQLSLFSIWQESDSRRKSEMLRSAGSDILHRFRIKDRFIANYLLHISRNLAVRMNAAADAEAFAMLFPKTTE